jgi:hypothetical protein
MLHAVRHVYNLSFPLACLLTFFGFLTSGKISYNSESGPRRSQSEASLAGRFLSLFEFPTCTLDLASLSMRGNSKITHNASLVHPDDIPSTSPDPALLAELFWLAHAHKRTQGMEGLTLDDLGSLHAKREASSAQPLDWLHRQVSLGECGLAWSVLRERPYVLPSGDSYLKNGRSQEHTHPELLSVIPLSRLRQWFGEERLPDHWWNGVRPVDEIGIFEARWRAGEVASNTKSPCGPDCV